MKEFKAPGRLDVLQEMIELDRTDPRETGRGKFGVNLLAMRLNWPTRELKAILRRLEKTKMVVAHRVEGEPLSYSLSPSGAVNGEA